MVDVQKLKEEQLKLAPKVSIVDRHKKYETIGGASCAYMEEEVIAVTVVCNASDFSIIEQTHARAQLPMPYISSYLFYREGPAIMESFNKLQQKPDILMVQGNGLIHPRRIGMASHLGIVLDTPTLGVAKKLALGQLKEGTIYLDKEARGYAYVTRQHANPLYISPGHAISLQSTLELVKKSIIYPHKLPEPLHHAHRIAKKIRDKKI